MANPFRNIWKRDGNVPLPFYNRVKQVGTPYERTEVIAVWKDKNGKVHETVHRVIWHFD